MMNNGTMTLAQFERQLEADPEGLGGLLTQGQLDTAFAARKWLNEGLGKKRAELAGVILVVKPELGSMVAPASWDDGVGYSRARIAA